MSDKDDIEFLNTYDEKTFTYKVLGEFYIKELRKKELEA